MCGIGGVLGKYDDSVLKSISKSQSHRGPDHNGLWEDDSRSVGLCHQRLSILDLSSLGNQPMISQNDEVVIVYNGEIYNFLELRRELESNGVQFRGSSDTEVLLNLYMQEGIDVVRRLNGIFTFAIWNKVNKQLFIARDALGVKPLYYSVQDDFFVFASEAKSIIPLLIGKDEYDIETINRYLCFLWSPGSGTSLKSVKKLLPGQAMLVGTERILSKWTWYQLPVCRRKRLATSKTDLLQETAVKLRQAVHRQLVSDVPVGAFLSGGLDSSAVVAFAREKIPNLSCFTIEVSGGQGDGFTDDLPYAKQVASFLHVDLEVVSINASKMAADLERMVYQLDEPLADPAPLYVFYISELARSQGIKVLLSGAGGDDLFSGYRRHLALMSESWWSWLPLQVRKWLARWSQSLDQVNPFTRRFSKLFSGADLNADARLLNYFRWIRRLDLEFLYTPEFREQLIGSHAEEPMMEFLQTIPKEAEPLEKMLALEKRFFLADHNLNYTDKMSMATGVEVRVPFLDLDLVEFASQIPSRYKQKGREGKWILKKAMEEFLPKSIIYRPKSGFGAPVRSWMRHELREMLGDYLSSSSFSRRGIFDTKKIADLMLKNDSGKIDASYTLLSLLCFEIWCRKFVDNHPSMTICN